MFLAGCLRLPTWCEHAGDKGGSGTGGCGKTHLFKTPLTLWCWRSHPTSLRAMLQYRNLLGVINQFDTRVLFFIQIVLENYSALSSSLYLRILSMWSNVEYT